MSTDIGFETTIAAHWDDHAIEQWYNHDRNDGPRQDHRYAFAASVRVEYDDVHSGRHARYHPGADVLLICADDTVNGRSPVVVTCIDLTDRPPAQQQRVREQVGGDGDE